MLMAVLWLDAGAAGTAAAARPVPAAQAASGYGSALPRFALFGWLSPPRESTTVARYRELAATGFNVTLPVLGETGTLEDNALRLEVTRPLGIRNLLLDNALDSVWTNVPASLELADSIVARYRDDPAFLGYYLGDEPAASTFRRLGEWFDILRERDPAHPAWNSLRPRWLFASRDSFQEYVQEYVDATHPAVLCNNQYDFTLWGDAQLLTENIATLGSIARANGVPFWGIVQLTEHWRYRHVTAGMLRWQIAQWLAWGASGIGFFTYWTPPSDEWTQWQPAMIEWGTGERTLNYKMVTALNTRLAPLGNTLAGMQWTATTHAGSVPPGGVPFTPDSVLTAVEGRATLGWFADSTFAVYLFVANADSLLPQEITLTLADGCLPSQMRTDGSAWDPLPVDAAGRVVLAPDAGDFMLLRIPVPARLASVGPRPGGATLSLRNTPNPASGLVRFEVAGTSGPARLDVLDLSGRVIWSRTLASGGGAVTWRGERERAGRAASGIYFARLRDARGMVVRRIAWLGAR
jgi:hypothetical protein